MELVIEKFSKSLGKLSFNSYQLISTNIVLKCPVNGDSQCPVTNEEDKWRLSNCCATSSIKTFMLSKVWSQTVLVGDDDASDDALTPNSVRFKSSLGG